ncbi:S1/P1 nuclease [Rhodoferax saidenbachensis]|nr:S1/P1 nuclease [Rhodoferax saidenbachensis]
MLAMLATVAFASQAGAWGVQGHQVVAGIAQKHLSPKTRAEVERLLQVEPGATLESISTWADEHKNRTTAPWHYVNFPRDTCVYEAKRDCPDGQCLIAAIQRQIEALGSAVPDEKRLLALKYLVHLIADVHQPLHAGYLDDKGGNKYQLQAFMRGSNLHAVWDTGLIRNLDEGPSEIAKRLTDASLNQASLELEPIRAAEESCKIVGTPGFYPDRKIDATYIRRYTPVMESRLQLAGLRLAGILNRALK